MQSTLLKMVKNSLGTYYICYNFVFHLQKGKERLFYRTIEKKKLNLSSFRRHEKFYEFQ